MEQLNSSCVCDSLCSYQRWHVETVFDLAMFLCECEFCLCVSGSVAHFTVAMQLTIDYTSQSPGLSDWELAGQPFDLSVFVKLGRGGAQIPFLLYVI